MAENTETTAPEATDEAQGDGKDRKKGGQGDQKGKRFRRRGPGRKRPCRDCDFVDFKDVELLRRNCTQQWKIQGRKRNGTCSRCQSLLKAAVKRARFMALVPYVG